MAGIKTFNDLINRLRSILSDACDGEESISPQIVRNLEEIFNDPKNSIRSRQIEWNHLKENNDETFIDNEALAYAKVLYLTSGEDQFLHKPPWNLHGRKFNIFEALYFERSQNASATEEQILVSLKKNPKNYKFDDTTKKLLELKYQDKSKGAISKKGDTLNKSFDSKNVSKNGQIEKTELRKPHGKSPNNPKSPISQNPDDSAEIAEEEQHLILNLPFLKTDPPQETICNLLKRSSISCCILTEADRQTIQLLTKMPPIDAWYLVEKKFIIPWMRTKLAYSEEEEDIWESHKKVIDVTIDKTISKIKVKSTDPNIERLVDLMYAMTSKVDEIQNQLLSIGQDDDSIEERPEFHPPIPVQKEKQKIPTTSGIVFDEKDFL